jgi:hypothetical protein
MRVFSHILEFLVLAFLITTFIFMYKQPHIDVAKVKQEADKKSEENLDRLNTILLDEDSTTNDTAAAPN